MKCKGPHRKKLYCIQGTKRRECGWSTIEYKEEQSREIREIGRASRCGAHL
jgi:hypothetical protein